MQYVNGASMVTSLLKAQPGTAKLETQSCVPKKSIAEHYGSTYIDDNRHKKKGQ